MGKRFNFGSNQKHDDAVQFVINDIDGIFETTTKVGELPCDIIVRKRGHNDILCFISVIKTTKSSLYGATTLSEWQFAYQNEQNFFFAVVIGDCQTKTTTEIFYYTPKQLCEMSSLPPFYYKCSIRKKYRKDHYKKMNLSDKIPVEKESKSYVLLEEKTQPTKSNIKKAISFFDKLR